MTPITASTTTSGHAVTAPKRHFRIDIGALGERVVGASEQDCEIVLGDLVP